MYFSLVKIKSVSDEQYFVFTSTIETCLFKSESSDTDLTIEIYQMYKRLHIKNTR